MTARRKMMKHQAAGFRWLMPRDFGALFWEMRCGKTLPSHRWAWHLLGATPRLISAPLSVVPRWREDLEADGRSVVVLEGSPEKCMQLMEERPDADFYVTNHEKLIDHSKQSRGKKRAVPSAIAAQAWGTVILDESSKFRNPKAKITQVATSILCQAPYRIALTGLPNPEGIEGFVCQMIFLLGGQFMGCRTFWEWRAKHMQPVGYEWHVKRESLKIMKMEIDKHASFLTRKQAGIGGVKVRRTRWVTLPSKVMRAIRQALTDMQVGDRLAMNHLQVMTWMVQLAGGRYPDESLHHDAKIDELLDLAKGEQRGEPMVIWARHTAEILAIAEKFKKKGRLKVDVAYGGTRSRNESTIDRFKRGKFDYLVAQPKSFQMGQDFSRCDTAWYYSNWPDYEVRRQSEDRIEHPMKSETLLIGDVVGRDTYDEDLVQLLNEKRTEAAMFRKKLMARYFARKEST